VARAPVLPLGELAADPALLFQDRFFDLAQAHPAGRRNGQALVVDLKTDRAAARPAQPEVAHLPAQHDPAQAAGRFARGGRGRIERQAQLPACGCLVALHLRHQSCSGSAGAS
jgi:hypothetical protein